MQYLARIKPTSKREVQVVDGVAYQKHRGWYGPLDEQTADRLRALPENDLNPTASPRVFDVMERGEAAQVEQAEQAKAEPAGTTAEPVDPPAPPPEPKRSSRGKRSHKADEVEAETSSTRRKRGRG